LEPQARKKDRPSKRSIPAPRGLTGNHATQLQPILRLGPHQFQLPRLPEKSFRIIDEAGQRFAAAFPLIMSHVFLKLFAKLSLTTARRRTLNSQGDALRFEPKVGPIAGSITRRSGFGPDIVKI